MDFLFFEFDKPADVFLAFSARKVGPRFRYDWRKEILLAVLRRTQIIYNGPFRL